MPKQFNARIGDKTLFAMTLERVAGLAGVRGAIVVTGSRHLDLVRSELSGSTGVVETILVEPEARNTAPAAIAAALVANPDDVVLILPSDHLIADLAGFHDGVARAVSLASSGGIVTFGIKPTRPETGFGYIEMGDPVGQGFAVKTFKEKPVEPDAVEMVADGRHLWNSGMFVARADHLLNEAEQHCPEVLESVSASLPGVWDGQVDLGWEFGEAEAISIDYAIMERTERSIVVPLDVGWDDIGSYHSLHAVSPQDELGNHISGEVTVSNVRGSYIHSTSRPLVVAGLEDVVVVETPDGVLVVPLGYSQDVGDLQKGATPG
jgi:mannose-1-phosphate guanylyltransferase/mannose-6-phosphate isomerase